MASNDAPKIVSLTGEVESVREVYNELGRNVEQGNVVELVVMYRVRGDSDTLNYRWSKSESLPRLIGLLELTKDRMIQRAFLGDG